MKKVIRLTESELISLVKRVINENDPKVGTGKNQKVRVEDYIQMKIQVIRCPLNLKQNRTLLIL